MQSAEAFSPSASFDILKDCVAYQVLQASKEQKEAATRANRRGRRGDPEAENVDEDLAAELDEFVLYLAQEIYEALPMNLKSDTIQEDSNLDHLSDSLAVPPAFIETLTTYSFSSNPDAASEIFYFIIGSFVSDWKAQASTTAIDESVPPPHGWKSTRTEECEICTRTVPLTYHHLIPRSTHQKVLKRKWHPESRLNAVAWLCRPCHSAVHKSAKNEDLARDYYTVELLMQNEALQRWAVYASRQRWGVRRG